MGEYSWQAGGSDALRPMPRPAGVAASSQLLARSGGEDVDLLLGELNHRIRNLLTMVEAVVRQTQSTDVEEYRTKLMARISGLRGLFEVIGRAQADSVGLAELIEASVRPFCANRRDMTAVGRDIELEPRLALALHLVFHELATNAHKYGALCAGGEVSISWVVGQRTGTARRLAIAWTERGGPEVQEPAHRGFGTRVIMRALDGYGEAQLEFKTAGVACTMLIDLDRAVQACA
jgi:two-component sensor histidine kinase